MSHIISIIILVCRTLGIPARSVTNFESAHDTDFSMTIDQHVDLEGRPIKNLDDSVWWDGYDAVHKCIFFVWKQSLIQSALMVGNILLLLNLHLLDIKHFIHYTGTSMCGMKFGSNAQICQKGMMVGKLLMQRPRRPVTVSHLQSFQCRANFCENNST